MDMFDIIGSIFRSLSDPAAMAKDMAHNGIAPDDLMREAQKQQQLQTTPTAGAQTGSNAKEQQNQGGNSISNLFQDLISPTPPTAQAGQAGNGIADFLKQIGGALGQPMPATAQQGQAGQAISNAAGQVGGAISQVGHDLMQPMPATAQQGQGLAALMQPQTGSNAQQGAPQTQQVMQPMPATPPGFNTTAMGMPPVYSPPNGMPSTAALSMPPQGTSQFPDRPGVLAPNMSNNLGLAMQPNTQPMQTDQPGTERPGAQPHLNASDIAVRDEAIQAFHGGGITNPFGLAALASTGVHESGFNPANLARTWSDPSQSGAKGTSGGMFSWRNERLTALQNYAKAHGETGNGSPKTQADFFMQENPTIVSQLNAAKSVDEAQQIMNRNIAFAGFDKPTGESARRMQTARTMVPVVDKIIGGDGNVPTPTERPVDQAAPDAAAPATPPTGGSGTPAAGGPMKNIFSALDALDTSKNGNQQNPDLNLPPPPRPVDPQHGQYQVNPATMQLMMSLLGPLMGQQQQQKPSIGQMMGG